VRKIKVHDEDIISMKLSKKLNIIYTLDKAGILKVTDFVKGEVRSKFILGDKNNDTVVSHFDIDDTEKNIVFSKNMNLCVFDIDKNTISLTSTVNSEINYLHYSSDGKFIVTSSAGDYFIHLWHKINFNEPLITLQLNSLTNITKMKFIEKGVYHLFSYSNSAIYGFNLILNEIDPLVPVKCNIEINFPNKNLHQTEMINTENLNSPHSIFILYGRTFNSSNIFTKIVNYSKNSKIFKEIDCLSIVSETNGSAAKSSKAGVNINPSKVNILNELQMNQEIDNDVNSTDIESNPNSNAYAVSIKKTMPNEEIKIENEKISLINMIRNSIINNDNSSFEWALDQKDFNLIDSTVKKMDSNLIAGFVSKLIETFQSSVLFKRNMLPWLDLLFNYHLLEIIQLPKKTLANLKNIQILIQNRIKNLDRLKEISYKLDTLINVTKSDKNKKSQNNKNSNKSKTYEPLLVYNESDSENEKTNNKKISSLMKRKGITITTEKKFKDKKKINFEDDKMDEDLMDNQIDDDFVMDLDEDFNDKFNNQIENKEDNNYDMDDEEIDDD
jgi:hypothetical protein